MTGGLVAGNLVGAMVETALRKKLHFQYGFTRLRQRGVLRERQRPEVVMETACVKLNELSRGVLRRPWF